MNGVDYILNQYAKFYLALTVISGGVLYLASNKFVVGIAVVLFIMNFIFFLAFFNADDEEIKEAEEVFKGEDSDKDDD